MKRAGERFDVEWDRVPPNRAPQKIADRQAKGWELTGTEKRRWRVELEFRRPSRAPWPVRHRRLTLTLVTVMVVLVMASIGGVRLLDGGKESDSDADGILDRVEAAGWSNQGGDRYTSDPRRTDTDADGLTDGVEAGAQLSTAGRGIRATVSDPRQSDTDDDGVGDTDEFLLDMDPNALDTDADGLDDAEELTFGSDPTRANGDDDEWSDLEERNRDSDPLSYDLTSRERAAAAAAGARYGDCYSCARNDGLREEQIDSVFYVTGQITSSFSIIGGLRDLGSGLQRRNYWDAGSSLVGLVPGYGNAGKVSAILIKFASRGGRAASAAYDLVQRLPESLRKRLPSRFLVRSVTLPSQLTGGPADNIVYLAFGSAGCPTYVGITRDLARRSVEHARAGRCFIPESIASGVTRGQAHAIEEACLVQGGLGTAASTVQNIRHSINPSASFYADAVAYGTDYLSKQRVACG